MPPTPRAAAACRPPASCWSKAGVADEPGFLVALEAVLEVLPVSKTFTGIDEPSGPVAEAASDFEALEMLRRLAFSQQVDAPTQLELWKNN